MPDSKPLRLLVQVAAMLVLSQCGSPASETNSKSKAPRVLLAIFAHPDDEESVSPVLAKYAAEGVTVYLAIATDGRLGVSAHAGIPAGDSLAAVRTAELKCAAEKLGIQPPIQFGLHDQMKMKDGLNALSGQLDTLRQAVRNLFTTLKPDAVLTWGASGWSGHPDHRLTGAVVTEVFQSQQWGRPNQLYYAEIPTGSLPRNPVQWATVDSSFLTVKIPVSKSDYDKAKASFLCHRSQYTLAEIDQMQQLVRAALKNTAYFRPLLGVKGEQHSLFP